MGQTDFEETKTTPYMVTNVSCILLTYQCSTCLSLESALTAHVVTTCNFLEQQTYRFIINKTLPGRHKMFSYFLWQKHQLNDVKHGAQRSRSHRNQLGMEYVNQQKGTEILLWLCERSQDTIDKKVAHRLQQPRDRSHPPPFPLQYNSCLGVLGSS